MKHNFNFEVETLTFQAGKFPVSLKGIKISAEAEYSAEEIQAEGSVFCQVIDQMAEKLGWLKPLVEKQINIRIHNSEMLYKDLEKQIAEGTCRAYGPRGWSVSTTDLHKPCECNKKH